MAAAARADRAGDHAASRRALCGWAAARWAASSSAIRRTELGALLQGQQLRLRQCLGCGAFAPLSAEPCSVRQLYLQGAAASPGEALSLEAMLAAQAAALELDAGYRCDGCGRLGATKMREALLRLPKVLVVHLNRATLAGGRLATRVAFEDELDLRHCLMWPTRPTDYSDRPCGARYRLYAVVVHRGASSRSGHYLAYARAPHAWRAREDGRGVPTAERFDDPLPTGHQVFTSSSCHRISSHHLIVSSSHLIARHRPSPTRPLPASPLARVRRPTRGGRRRAGGAAGAPGGAGGAVGALQRAVDRVLVDGGRRGERCRARALAALAARPR